jgi:hypothetical protein
LHNGPKTNLSPANSGFHISDRTSIVIVFAVAGFPLFLMTLTRHQDAGLGLDSVITLVITDDIIAEGV